MSVCGIMILIALLLILNLIVQSATDRAESTEPSLDELRAQIKSLETDRREIQDEIMELQQIRDITNKLLFSTEEGFESLQSSIARYHTEITELDKALNAEIIRTELLTKEDNSEVMAEKQKIIDDLQTIFEELKSINNQLTATNESLQSQLRNLQTELQELLQKNSTLDQQIASANFKTDKIQFSQQQATDKSPMIVILGKSISVILLDTQDRKEFQSDIQFTKWMETRNRNTEYFVMYIKPSRIDDYKFFIKILKDAGFDVGFDVMGEQTDIATP